MYKIKIYNFKKKYLLKELIDIFLNPVDYIIIEDEDEQKADFVFNKSRKDDRNKIKRDIYDALSEVTGYRPAWGILTGIRPVKLCGDILYQTKDIEKTKQYLKEYYYLSDEKITLLLDLYTKQYNLIGEAEKQSASVYIGIPFCPTRCLYCSFTSNAESKDELERYLNALETEIIEVSRLIKENDIEIETIYVGGGTPTTFDEFQLERLMKLITKCFDLKTVKEFTVEAGRPDTITREKLEILKNFNVGRISINPQTMKDETLRIIGRNHSVKEIQSCFKMAREIGFDSINTDLIAGLPKESFEDFEKTLNEVLELKPDNITIHSLAMKRRARLKIYDPVFHYKQGIEVIKMIEESKKILKKYGYKPYYLYRQKHMAGALENTGYTLASKEGIYNMRIMDEHQKIIALGAGGISKAYDYETRTLERVPNLKNYKEYINRVDEMIKRKKDKLF